MTDFAQQERRALCDLFIETGPGEPTLCEGWTTGDLAAHIVLRERRPDAGLGIVVGALAPHAEKVRQELRERPWPDLVATIRSGPPVLLRPVDELMNTVEFFVHLEDVRRAQPVWATRSLEPGLEAALWRRVDFLSRGLVKKAHVRTVLDAPGYGGRARGTGETVTITGRPGELLLFVAGRKDVAKVEFSGDAEAVARVQDAKVGL